MLSELKKKPKKIQNCLDKYLHKDFFQLVLKASSRSYCSSNFRSGGSFALLEGRVRSSEKGRFLYKCILQTASSGGVSAIVMAGVPRSGSLLAAVQRWRALVAAAVGFGCSTEVPGGRVIGESEQVVRITEDGWVFPEALQNQEPEPHVARKEGKIEITLEGQGWKLLRWRRPKVCYFQQHI